MKKGKNKQETLNMNKSKKPKTNNELGKKPRKEQIVSTRKDCIFGIIA
jgi:hypothetical protein